MAGVPTTATVRNLHKLLALLKAKAYSTLPFSSIRQGHGDMHKAIFVLLLAVVSSNAMAEWIKVFSDDTTTIYVNISTMQRGGNTVKMQNLSDYRAAQKAKNGIIFLSTIEPGEYDCKDKKIQALSLSLYSKNMGGGNIVYSESFPKVWIPANTDSIDHILWKFACGKK